jgi:BRCT domain type II-containing protein
VQLAGVRGGRVIEEFFLDRVAVEPATVHSRRVVAARARPRASRSRAKNSMSVRTKPGTPQSPLPTHS